MSEKYHRETGTTLQRGSREVVECDQGVCFWCPCGEREVYVSSPPHTITFDEEGVLTLDGSCGYHATDVHPANWCHFWLKDGEAKMVSDAKCPGSSDKAVA